MRFLPFKHPVSSLLIFRSHAEMINDIIRKNYVPTMQDCEVDGVKYDPPEQIPWYPLGLAWSLSAPKRVVRKSPPFQTFQRFLVGETEVVSPAVRSCLASC